MAKGEKAYFPPPWTYWCVLRKFHEYETCLESMVDLMDKIYIGVWYYKCTRNRISVHYNVFWTNFNFCGRISTFFQNRTTKPHIFIYYRFLEISPQRAPILCLRAKMKISFSIWMFANILAYRISLRHVHCQNYCSISFNSVSTLFREIILGVKRSQNQASRLSIFYQETK